jgi:hypothetical protein
LSLGGLQRFPDPHVAFSRLLVQSGSNHPRQMATEPRDPAFEPGGHGRYDHDETA